MVLAFLLLLTSSPGGSQEPSVLAPNRYQPPPQSLSPLEQQKALTYRSQIQTQLRRLEQQRDLPKGARDTLLLPQTRSELDRLNELLQPRP